MSDHDEDDILDTYVNRAEGARRGAVISNEGKTRITMYLDNDVIEHFRKVATAKGRGYQTEINSCLRQVMARELEDAMTGSANENANRWKVDASRMVLHCTDLMFEDLTVLVREHQDMHRLVLGRATLSTRGGRILCAVDDSDESMASGVGGGTGDDACRVPAYLLARQA